LGYLQGFLVPCGILSLLRGLEDVHEPSTNLKVLAAATAAGSVIAGDPQGVRTTEPDGLLVKLRGLRQGAPDGQLRGGAVHSGSVAETRKTVTIVFSDVADSTSLGERLDPEAMRRVMERYFEEMRTVLERHGGTVEKFIGDAIMAAFGIPAAHEDDALRAVRAAAEMREHLAALNDELERERGVTLSIRTGINTGEVVAGAPESGQFYATGDAVNVAARLEQGAEPGEILLGEQTHRLVHDAVQAEALNPLALKGKAETVAAYRLLEVIEGAPAVARRLDTPFVGRRDELASLLASFERSIEQRTPVLATVLGPAGIGKTRLATELAAAVQGQARVLQGRCLSYGEGITFWPLQEILRGLPERPPNSPDPEQAGSIEETFWAYRKFFEALAQEGPLVVVLEDIHWAEPTLLDLIEHVVEWTREAPLLLVCLARLELLDERPGWAGERIELEPLPNEEAEKLVATLAADLEPAVRARATEAAEGNPLFLEQLLALAVEDGQEAAVPHTIQALLAARIDRLAPDERLLLEAAAVVGKEFWRGALLDLAQPDTQVSALLQQLVRKRLIQPERSTFPGEDAFQFGHILIRDATYTGIAKEVRAELHERFAEWLEQSASRYDEIVGYHLEQAYRYRTELGVTDDSARALAIRAGAKLSGAGESALARNDLPAAVNLLTRATNLHDAGGQPRLDLLVDLGAALFPLGEGPKALAVLDEALEAMRAAGEPVLEWRARLERNYVLGQLEPDAIPVEEDLRTAERAILALERLGDHRGLGRAWQAVTQDRFWLGKNESALEASERALEYARRAGDRQGEIWALRLRSKALWSGPTPAAEAAQSCEEMLAAAESEEFAATALEHLGGLRAMQGQFEEARRLVDRSLAIYEELGFTFRLAVSLGAYSATVHALSGDVAAAEHELRNAVELLESIGEKGARSTLTAFLAGTLYALGRYSEAEWQADLSEQLAGIDDRETHTQLASVRAKILARQGDLESAKSTSDKAIRMAEPTDDLNTRGHLWMDKAEVLRLAGDPEGAASCLERAIDLFDRKGNVVMAGRARASLAQLGEPSQAGFL
jgi:class 3 adenylate cyclase/tetratricopeptide (TPR) repeat protein